MSRFNLAPLALATMLAFSGCTTLAPRVPEAAPEIAAQWPTANTIPTSTAGSEAPAPILTGDASAIGWRSFFVDEKLEALVAQALQNNRDLRVAVLNVQRARDLYRVQRADRLPAVGAGATLQRSGGDDIATSSLYSADVDAGFELDLFGRVRSLSAAALQQYFATAEARRSAQLSLVGEVAGVYLTLAADLEAQRIAQATLATHEASFSLAGKRHELGAASAMDLSVARTQVESARADNARYAGQVAQDSNALTLLLGSPLPASLMPTGFAEQATAFAELPAGLPSKVLLQRPDVLAAEHQLLAANANIGAARAAFFPSISLTGAAGSASDALSGLLGGGTGTWSFMPKLTLPIFQGGRLRANLGVATADRNIALARYEKSIQSGFRDVADALALSQTLAAQRQAQEALVAAAATAETLSRARYEAGRDSYLVRLDAQRTLYAAQQGLVATRLAEQANRVTLYTALGGGWSENDL